VLVPPVAIAPAMSSRYFAAAAITARAESFTVEGACPSAQLIEESAVALLAAVRDHFQKLIVGSQRQKPRAAGLEVVGVKTSGELGLLPSPTKPRLAGVWSL
jgi:hypothetical protein